MTIHRDYLFWNEDLIYPNPLSLAIAKTIGYEIIPIDVGYFLAGG